MSTRSVKSLQSLVTQSGAGLGLSEKSSSIIVANINGTTAPMCLGEAFDDEEQSTDDFRLIQFVLDSSSSMEEVEDEVREGMNDIVMPGLLGGALDQVGAIRYSGLHFGSSVQQLWPGWSKLESTFPPLTSAEYRANGATALNRAVLDAVTGLTSQALQVEDQTGTFPECVLAVLTDGANNMAPQNPAGADQVKTVLDDLSAELFTLVFIGFETFERVDFRQVAKDMGFRDVKDLKMQPGETKDDLRRRMRHTLKVFSNKLVGRVSTSRIGTVQSATAPTGFWI